MKKTAQQRIALVSVPALLLSFAGLSNADTKVELINRSFDERAETPTERSQTIYLAPGKARMEADEGYMLYDGSKPTFYVVNTRDKSYMEFDDAAVKEMSDMMAQVKKQLEQLPAEQRAMIEQSMQGRSMMPQEREPLRFQTTSETKRIGSYDCTRVDAFRGDRKEQELWVASLSDVNVPSSDFATMKEMQQHMKSLASPFISDADMGSWEVEGVPVFVTFFDDQGNKEMENELKSVTFDSIAGSVFALPEGFKRTEMPRMPQR